MSLIDWATNKIKTFTGEKERHELVKTIKEQHEQHVNDVKIHLDDLNNLVKRFNTYILKINEVREEQSLKNLQLLHTFLLKFGHLSHTGMFSEEEKKEDYYLKERSFKHEEDYILKIDWSSDEVFKKTFYKSILGMKAENHHNNLLINEAIGEFRLKAAAVINAMDIEFGNIVLSTNIADLYEQTIDMVNETIEERILPELALIEAMLEAEKIKNLFIADESEDFSELSIQSLVKTPYEQHVIFMKNSFLFYVLAEKMYANPILTNLLDQMAENTDFEQLSEQYEVIQVQTEKLVPIEESVK